MNLSIPWVEKYRPDKLSGIDGNEYIKRSLGNYGGINSIPHLLFYGPPGTGKTSTILAMAKEYYGNNLKSMVLELNASDDREISVVRGVISTFCTNNSVMSSGIVKLVILDEADAMTVDAQSALRRVMEKNTRNIRFCICCNYINKISPALQSRCTKFRFKPLENDSLKNTAMRVIDNENVSITEEGICSIIDISCGDARKVINILQSLSLASSGKTISSEMVYKFMGIPNPKQIEYILGILLKCNFKESYDKIQKRIKDDGFSLVDIVRNLTNLVINDTSCIPDEKLGIILDEFSNIEYNLSAGGCENIQLGLLIGAFHL